MLSNIKNYAACAVCVTIFSTGGKFHPVSIFTQLVTRSYVLLLYPMHLQISLYKLTLSYIRCTIG